MNLTLKFMSFHLYYYDAQARLKVFNICVYDNLSSLIEFIIQNSFYVSLIALMLMTVN